MKILKWTLLTLIVGVIGIFLYNYPKLNLISGYSAKNMSSSVFVANRSLSYTDSHDNNISLINLAEDEIDLEEKYASATVFGMMQRKAIYREGLGSVLVGDDYDNNTPYLKPNRNFNKIQVPYPYGNLTEKDTIFKEVDYTALNKVINSFFDTGKENIKSTRAIIVLYKDHIIAEKYADGFDKNSRLLGWSMAKSILSTMYGVLEKEQKISLDSPVPVETWKNDDRKNISYRNLLQMNSGLEWEEDYSTISDVTKMLFLEEDMTQSQISKLQIHPPGTHWSYSSGTTNLLSGLLRNQFHSHQDYLDFPYKKVIDKIGMHSMILEADIKGNYVSSSYAWATARDWAKFGLLYLNNGNWNGEQIMNPSWVDFVNTPAPDSNQIYGGHFWLNAGGVMPNVPKDAFFPNGFQGQRIVIIPSQKMVVVRLGLKDIDFDSLTSGIINSINQPLSSPSVTDIQ